jgi:protein-L-isoaspartate(D-aspartate) O-methyltransferase
VSERHRPLQGNGVDPYVSQRLRMVRDHIAARGVRDLRVLTAMSAVPRHLFVPEQFLGKAYEDHPVEIGLRQTISQPFIVGHMTEWLGVEPTDRILEIGTGAGYQAAILSLLAHEVISVERHEALADAAQLRLDELGYENVRVVSGDGTLGYPEGAPYDGILVTAAAPHIPRALLEQLAPGGRLICPVGVRDHQELVRVERTDEGFEQRVGVPCVFVPLVGQEGWSA